MHNDTYLSFSIPHGRTACILKTASINGKLRKVKGVLSELTEMPRRCPLLWAHIQVNTKRVHSVGHGDLIPSRGRKFDLKLQSFCVVCRETFKVSTFTGLKWSESKRYGKRPCYSTCWSKEIYNVKHFDVKMLDIIAPVKVSSSSWKAEPLDYGEMLK